MEDSNLSVYTCTYMYVYLYVHMYIYLQKTFSGPVKLFALIPFFSPCDSP